jgi:chaperone required for assembly of F1-ATPase
MANILDVVQTIQNIVSAKGYDGALDEEGKPVKMGLNREVDNTVTDSRLVDGFGVRFQGDKLVLSYSSECNIKQVQKSNFEDMVEQKVADIISFIQKEYRGAAGKSLRLTKEGETDILVQKMSNIRTWYQTSSIYKIGSTEGVLEEDQPKDINESIKNWLKSAKN